MAPPAGATRPWTVLVPLKRLAYAKSRLGLPPRLRSELVAAMVADVVSAASAVARVCLVSAEPTATRFGVPVLPDRGGGLSLAVAHAARLVDGPVAVLAGDLPAVRSAELASALAAAAEVACALVADAQGTGTTLLASRSAAILRPAYGAESRHRHALAGMCDLTTRLDVPGLRRDVDTVDDLREAIALGLGPASSSLLRVDAVAAPEPLPTDVRAAFERVPARCPHGQGHLPHHG